MSTIFALICGASCLFAIALVVAIVLIVRRLLRGDKGKSLRNQRAPAQVAVPSVESSMPQVVEPIIAPRATPMSRSVLGVPNDPSTALELGLVLVSEGNRAQAIECFMFAFRNGSPDLRQRAIAEMEKLGEVENG